MVDVAVPRLGLTKRITPKSRSDDAEQALGRFVRVEAWNGLVTGDVVRVSGHSARGRHWRFRAHVTNTSNGASWVEVSLVEGPPPSRRPGAPAAAAATLSSSVGQSEAASSPVETPRVERVRSFAPELVTARWRRKARMRQRDQSTADSAQAQQALF
ncbi:MAG: hypothetical protein ACLPQS_09790 [Acidimicrobiales bacterium]